MTGDRETLSVYDKSVAEYERLVGDGRRETELADLIAALPARARVLDVGCGPGHAAAVLIAEGLDVDAFDGSAAMVAAAQARGVPARQAYFGDPLPDCAYDAVWCAFSLLHADRSEMPGHLSWLHRALRPGGIFVLGLKSGEGSHRDDLGRRYTYYGEAEIRGLLADAGFTVEAARTGVSQGLAGTVDPWIIVTARA